MHDPHRPLIDVVGWESVVLPDGARRPYVNLDNAATTPAARAVWEAVVAFVEAYGSVHRGSGIKSRISTAVFDGVAGVVRRFVGAGPDDLVVSAGNTTLAINRLARCYDFRPGDIVLISDMEHTSNDLPWRQYASVVRVHSTPAGVVDLDDLETCLKRFGKKVRLVALTGASNVTGYLPPIRPAARLAHCYGVEVFVDCAQLAAHRPLQMRTASGEEDLDYVAFSGHKMYAPFGAGVVVGRRKAFDRAPPDLPGGGTVDILTPDHQWWAALPARMEPGTPNAAGLVAMAAAMDLILQVGFDAIRRHEQHLIAAGLRVFGSIPAVTLHGQGVFQPEGDRLPIFPFTVAGYPHGLVAAVLGREYGIAVRHGHLCQHEFMRRELGIDPHRFDEILQRVLAGDKSSMYGMVRASCGLCTTVDEIEALGEALRDLLARGPRGKYRQQAASGDFTPETQQDELAAIVPETLRFLVAGNGPAPFSRKQDAAKEVAHESHSAD